MVSAWQAASEAGSEEAASANRKRREWIHILLKSLQLIKRRKKIWEID